MKYLESTQVIYQNRVWMVVRGIWEVTAQWHEIFGEKGGNFKKLTVVMVLI